MKKNPQIIIPGVLTLILSLMAPVSVSWAKAWREILPGTTPRQTVLTKLGQPTRGLNRGGKEVRGLLYQGDQAVKGTRQVQIVFSPEDVVEKIHVFPKPAVTRKQIMNTYGETFEEKLNDSFKTYFFYRKDGIVVYFGRDGKDNIVSSITFQRTQP